MPLLVRIEDGQIAEVELTDVPFAQIHLDDAPAADDERQDVLLDREDADSQTLEIHGITLRLTRVALRTSTITDLAWIDGTLLVAGTSNEEFSSTLRRIPFPFDEGTHSTSLEIFHVSHGKYETAAPIRTFIPFDGNTSVLASYTCTPIVHFPLADLRAGSQAKGRTVAELGSMNQPLDMIAYRHDGAEYLLVSNSRHPLLKIPAAPIADQEPLVTPSEPVGVPRVELDHAGVTLMANLGADPCPVPAARSRRKPGAAHLRHRVTLSALHLAWSSGGGDREALIVTGWSPAELAILRARDAGELAARFAVVPAEALARNPAAATPMAGEYRIEGAALSFRPRHGFVDGVAYEFLDGRARGGRSDGRSALTLTRPLLHRPPSTVVTGIHPTATTIPLNTLRVYVRFSAPMSEGFAAAAVRLRDVASGTVLEHSFLPMEPELWDPQSAKAHPSSRSGPDKARSGPARRRGLSAHAGSFGGVGRRPGVQGCRRTCVAHRRRSRIPGRAGRPRPSRPQSLGTARSPGGHHRAAAGACRPSARPRPCPAVPHRRR